MAGSDIEYYRNRALQEQVAAQNATSGAARRSHDEMAAMYRFKVSMLSDVWSEAGFAIALKQVSSQEPQLINC